MIKNPEGPTLQRVGQTNESAARKPVAVRPCPGPELRANL